MRKGAIVPPVLALVAALALGACGGSNHASAPGSTTVQQLSSSSWEKAGPLPSESAKMVCQKEAQTDIAGSLTVAATRVTTPTWVEAEHLYSCTYVYPQGKVTLSVKDMSSEQETTAYFDGIEQKYGVSDQLIGLGQGAEVLKNGDAVVRKDYKVLFVDVHAIPENFTSLMKRSDVSTGIAVAIMGCWSGS
jgi:hypothetical protein